MLKDHGSKSQNIKNKLRVRIVGTRVYNSLRLSNFMPPDKRCVVDTPKALDNQKGVAPFSETTILLFNDLVGQKINYKMPFSTNVRAFSCKTMKFALTFSSSEVFSPMNDFIFVYSINQVYRIKFKP